MERNRLRLRLRKVRWRVRGEDVEEYLERVVEDDLVVLPGMHGAHLHRCLERRDFGLAAPNGCPGMQLEMVVECDSLLTGLGDEGDADLDFELSPSGLGDLKRGFVYI